MSNNTTVLSLSDLCYGQMQPVAPPMTTRISKSERNTVRILLTFLLRFLVTFALACFLHVNYVRSDDGKTNNHECLNR